VATKVDIKYCHCVYPNFAFENARVERGVGQWSDKEVWICNRCDGFHHVRQVPPMPRRAPRNAIALLHMNGRGDHGTSELVYSLPDSGRASILTIHTHNRRPPDTMPIQPTDMLLHCWERLDFYVVQIMAPTPIQQAAGDAGPKAAARAIAEVLAPMMVPFFTTADEIVREAVQRYKERDNPEVAGPS
jgi:hypothetical protein